VQVADPPEQIRAAWRRAIHALKQNNLRGSITSARWLTWTDAAFGHAVGHHRYACRYACSTSCSAALATGLPSSPTPVRPKT
jgi:hypothetical protein